MKDRAYRRWREEIIVKKRLREICCRVGWHHFHDGNDDIIPSPRWINYIGRIENFMYKTYTTDHLDTTYKTKYSANRNRKGYDREPGKIGTRESSKKEFLKILDSYGIKHVNTGQFQSMDCSEWISDVS